MCAKERARRCVNSCCSWPRPLPLCSNLYLSLYPSLSVSLCPPLCRTLLRMCKACLQVPELLLQLGLSLSLSTSLSDAQPRCRTLLRVCKACLQVPALLLQLDLSLSLSTSLSLSLMLNLDAGLCCACAKRACRSMGSCRSQASLCVDLSRSCSTSMQDSAAHVQSVPAGP